jgi:hypothetical protein
VPCNHEDAFMCLGRRELLRSLGAVVFGLGPLAVLLKTCEKEQGSPRKRASMIRLVSDSPSIVLRDTHILLIRIQSADSTEWANTLNGGQSRTVNFTASLLEVLKGAVREEPGQDIRVRIAQERIQTPLLLPPTGGWSDRTLNPGDQFVVFSISSSSSVAELLQVPACKQVLPASISLEDVHIAAKAEEDGLALYGILGVARPVAASLHHIFAEYLAARLPELSIETSANFGALMEFLELPSLAAPVRTSLLDSVDRYISSSDKTAEWHFDRLAITMFRLLGSSSEALFRDNLVSVDLPNLLGLTGGDTVRTANQVFHDHPQDRLATERTLRNYHGDSSTAALLAWLRKD